MAIKRKVEDFTKDMNRVISYKGRVGTLHTPYSKDEQRLAFRDCDARGSFSFSSLEKIVICYTELEASDISELVHFCKAKTGAGMATEVSTSYVPNGSILVNSTYKSEIWWSCTLISSMLKSGHISSTMFASEDEAILGGIVERYQGSNSRLEEHIPRMLGIGVIKIEEIK